jgi:putative transposase
MSYHSHTSLLFHCVFSTKDRLPLIPTPIKSRLWSYVGGIARVNDMKALAVGGIRDHLHVLLSLPPTMAIAKAVQLLKAGSSKWMHEQRVTQSEWQVGYGAFTIGISQVAATKNYILHQEKHHAKKSFAQEWQIFLRRHGLVEHPD